MYINRNDVKCHYIHVNNKYQKMIINISTQHDNKLSKGSHAKIKFKFLHEITALINGISSPFCAKCAGLQLFLLMGNQSLNFQVKL